MKLFKQVEAFTAETVKNEAISKNPIAVSDSK